MPTVSVILPVYNGEIFLAGAIESVLAQSYPNWELLVVDDGSTDGTASICDTYAQKDSRVKAFHQPNGGVNSARAKGVDEALGEYLVFLDADDALVDDALEYLVSSMADGIDLLAEGSGERILGKEEYLIELWKGAIGPALWGKMFRTEVYRKMDYALDKRLAMGEDLLLNSMCSLNASQIKVLPRKVYRVNRNNESSVTKTFKHNWEYEKLYFRIVQDQFLSRCSSLESFEQIRLLVNKSWLNAMKYVMLDGGKIDYDDSEFKSVRDYFSIREKDLGLSEKLIFKLKNPSLYRIIVKQYIGLLRKKK